jgi:hypothetical protein
MAISVDNIDPDRLPSPLVPPDFIHSVPARSDSVLFTGDFHDSTGFNGQYPGFSCVATHFRQFSRLRTWIFLDRLDVQQGSPGQFSKKTIEGVIESESVVNSWEGYLGLSVGADWGVISAKMTAALTRRNERSASVTLSKEIETAFEHSVHSDHHVISVAQQLEETFSVNSWFYFYPWEFKTPTDITPQMISEARAILKKALSTGEIPKRLKHYPNQPSLTSLTDMYTIRNYPDMQELELQNLSHAIKA